MIAHGTLVRKKKYEGELGSNEVQKILVSQNEPLKMLQSQLNLVRAGGASLGPSRP